MKGKHVAPLCIPVSVIDEDDDVLMAPIHLGEHPPPNLTTLSSVTTSMVIPEPSTAATSTLMTIPEPITTAGNTMTTTIPEPSMAAASTLTTIPEPIITAATTTTTIPEPSSTTAATTTTMIPESSTATATTTLTTLQPNAAPTTSPTIPAANSAAEQASASGLTATHSSQHCVSCFLTSCEHVVTDLYFFRYQIHCVYLHLSLVSTTNQRYCKGWACRSGNPHLKFPVWNQLPHHRLALHQI